MSGGFEWQETVPAATVGALNLPLFNHIDKYETVRDLGEGGFGKVCKMELKQDYR